MPPVIRDVARADREFPGRAVRFLAGDRGVRHFPDIGTGVPTVENTTSTPRRRSPPATGCPAPGGAAGTAGPPWYRGSAGWP